MVPHVPTASTAALVDALLAPAPKFISWVIGFVTVCVIWLNHHRLLALASRIDSGLFWLNANLPSVPCNAAPRPAIRTTAR
jgi:uncharacterized membrane protein